VQVWTEDERELIATIMAIPAQRLEARGHTTITFDERPGDSPMACAPGFIRVTPSARNLSIAIRLKPSTSMLAAVIK